MGYASAVVTEQLARPYHHGNLRAELLSRAIEVVSDRGVDALSLRELARDVGVSHAAPRRHFADRQALLDAVAVEGFDRLGAELQEAIAGAGARCADGLGALARAYIGFALRYPALLDLMFASKMRAGGSEVYEAAERAFEPALGLIAHGQGTGELVAGDTERLAKLAFATIQGLTSLANGGMLEGDELDAMLDNAIEQLLHGLRPRP
jgi:AcrR family transcriptional regulator